MSIKKNMLKITLIVLVSIINISIIGLAFGNPTTFSYVGPSTPDTSLPKLTISLPENKTIYNVYDVPYSITIQKPSSWFNYGSYNGQIFSVEYYLDNDPKVTIAEKEFDSLESLNSKDPITLKGKLTNLSDGNHVFQVFVYGVSYYQQPSPYPQGVPSNYYMNNNSTVVFKVNTVTPTIEPPVTNSIEPSQAPANKEPNFRETYVAIAVAIISLLIVLSLLVFGRHRLRRNNAKEAVVSV